VRRRHPSDRRRFTRLDEDLIVDCRQRGSGPSSVAGQTRNLSAGGVCFLADDPLPLYLDVTVTLHLPGDPERLTFAGRVVRVRSLGDRTHEVAIEFAGAQVTKQRALQEHIEAYLGARHRPAPPIPA
jgi:Tfp pilus assembly protein PilZ